MTELFLRGLIPEPSPELKQQLAKGPTDQEWNVTREHFRRFVELAGITTRACLIDPPIADEADDTHIALADLSISDQRAIFRWANSETATEAPVRDKQGRGRRRRFRWPGWQARGSEK